jgi:hypothetical protein
MTQTTTQSPPTLPEAFVPSGRRFIFPLVQPTPAAAAATPGDRVTADYVLPEGARDCLLAVAGDAGIFGYAGTEAEEALSEEIRKSVGQKFPGGWKSAVPLRAEGRVLAKPLFGRDELTVAIEYYVPAEGLNAKYRTLPPLTPEESAVMEELHHLLTDWPPAGGPEVALASAADVSFIHRFYFQYVGYFENGECNYFSAATMYDAPEPFDRAGTVRMMAGPCGPGLSEPTAPARERALIEWAREVPTGMLILKGFSRILEGDAARRRGARGWLAVLNRELRIPVVGFDTLRRRDGQPTLRRVGLAGEMDDSMTAEACEQIREAFA